MFQKAFSKHIVHNIIILWIVKYISVMLTMSNDLFQNVVVKEHCEYLVCELSAIH
jgi:hypothetical protein